MPNTKVKWYKHQIVPIWKGIEHFTKEDKEYWYKDAREKLIADCVPPERILSYVPDPEDPEVFIARVAYSDDQVDYFIYEYLHEDVFKEKKSKLNKQLPQPIYCFEKDSPYGLRYASISLLWPYNLDNCLGSVPNDYSYIYVDNEDIKGKIIGDGNVTETIYRMRKPEATSEEFEKLEEEHNYELFLELTTPIGDYVREIFNVW